MRDRQHGYLWKLWVRNLGCAAAALLVLAPASSRAGIIYDLTADWSDVSNPNGVWTYREGANALPSVADWTPIGPGTPQPAWAPSTASGNFLPAWMKSTRDNPGGLDILIGDVFLHSTDPGNGGANGVANVIWSAPQAGTVDLTGTIWMGRDIGRANDWSLLLNGAAFTGGSVFSGDPFDRANPMDFASGSGGAGALSSLGVSAGDVIELRVARASNAGDLVGVTFAVDLTPVPEPHSAALLACGLLALALRRSHRQAF